jgi:predicted GNAT family acetyltransferase
MVFKEETFLNKLGDQVTPLGPSHLDAILALFNGHADRPDAFSRDQLENGIFYGVFEGRELLSVAGTHVKSKPMRVGAIGNVFTRPDRRRQGMATRTSAAVVKALLSSGIDTIVLNVSMGNEPALRCYRNLGFWPYCGYYEGVGEIINVNNRNLEN